MSGALAAVLPTVIVAMTASVTGMLMKPMIARMTSNLSEWAIGRRTRSKVSNQVHQGRTAAHAAARVVEQRPERGLVVRLATPPGFHTASIASLLLGPKFGERARDIRADCVTEWVEAEATGNQRLARWLRVRTSMVIITNAIVYVVRLPLDLALKVKQLFFK